MGLLVEWAEVSGFATEERHYDGRVGKVRDVVVDAEAPLHGLEDVIAFRRWQGNVFGFWLVISAVRVEVETPATFLFAGVGEILNMAILSLA